MTRHMSELDTLDLQNQGQQLYRQEKYEDALKCFDQALSSSTKSPIAVYDNRAATYTKLGRLKCAFCDGIRMMKKDNSNCTGYLRTAKVLQLMGKPIFALKIYQRGLDRTHPSDANADLLQTLQTLHDQLAKQLDPSKAVDPFQALPIDIVDMILRYLTFRETICLTKVSKSWRDLLSSMPRLWRDLNFSSNKQPTLTAVRQYQKNAQGKCSILRLNRFEDLQRNILRYAASQCRELREVWLGNGNIGETLLQTAPSIVNLQTLYLSPSSTINMHTVSLLLDRCLNLERAEFHAINAQCERSPTRAMPKMHTLVMNASRECSGRLSYHGLLGKIENIRSLTLGRWMTYCIGHRPLDFSQLPLLEHLTITDSETDYFPLLPKSICTVKMIRCTLHASATFEPPGEPQVLPHLSTFSVAHTNIDFNYQALELLTVNEKGLRDVDLNEAVFGNDLTCLISDGRLSGVEKLSLEANPVGDEMALLIAQNMSNLKHLNLSRTTITGVGVKALITGLKGKLEWMGLDQCKYTSADAVTWARSEGVKVSYQFPDPKGGRKIRLQA